jgi:hypothetical protein
MIQNAILRTASLLVPAEHRPEWLDEWAAELAFVCHDSPRRATAFCFGAFRDAVWIRRNAPPTEARGVLLDSPLRCLMLLTTLAAITIAIAWRLPVPHQIFFHSGQVVTLSQVSGRLTKAQRAFLESRLPPEFEPGIINDHGMLLARLKSGAVHAGSRWNICIAKDDGRCLTVECTNMHSWRPVIEMLWLALMAMPLVLAGNSLSLGRCSNPRMWLFFAVKVGLGAMIAFFAIIDLGATTAAEIRPHGLILGLVSALRWALRDQRRRCPVCLRRLTNPIFFGEASHAFLDWYGTELICSEGHGMMHVPAIPTSSYPEPRWVTLDA